MWEIFSFGDVSILNLVFNAIAAFFQDGTFKAAAVAVCLFAVVGHSIANLGEGAKELPYAKLLAAVIIFGLGFQTLTKVSVENRYDGTVTQIDNIPVAIAVPQSLITMLGYNITRKVETAFGNTGIQRITDSGYLSPLKVIANLRKATYASECQGNDAMTGAGISLCKSLATYITDCSSVLAERDNQYTEQNEMDLMTAIGFNSASWGTTYYDEAGQPIEASCADAYNKIVGAFNGAPWDDMININNDDVGARAGENTQDRVTDALQAIQADASKSRNLIQTLYLARPHEIGTVNYLVDSGASDLAENYSSSITQRNYAWALQGELWVQIVDVFLTLMESLIISAAPIVALMTLTGASGAKSLLLYLQVLAVLQLIPIFMVIAQNIIMNKMVIFQSSLVARGWDEGSKAYMYELTRYANELMGLGGMVAATIVPALAIALVTGSGFALMGAMKGAAAPAKDTDAAPELAGQGGKITDMSNSLQGDYFRGGQSITERDQAQLAQMQTSQQATNSVKSAQTQQATASKNYSDVLSNSQQAVASKDFSNNELASVGNTISSGTSEQAKLINEQANSYAKANNFGEAETSQLRAMLGLGTSLGAKGDIASVNGSSASSEVNKAYKELTTGKKGEELAAKFEQAKQQDHQTGEQFRTGNSFADTQSAVRSQAYQELQSTSDNYEAAQQLQRIDSMSQSDQLANYQQLANDSRVMDNVERAVAALPEEQQQQYHQRVDDLTRNNADSDVRGGGLAELMAFSEVTRQNGNDLALADVVGGGYDTPTNSTGVNFENKGEAENAQLTAVNDNVENTINKDDALNSDNLRTGYNSNKQINEAGNNPYKDTQEKIQDGKQTIANSDINANKEERMAQVTGETIKDGFKFAGAALDHAKDGLDPIAESTGNVGRELLNAVLHPSDAVNKLSHSIGDSPSPESKSAQEQLLEASDAYSSVGLELNSEGASTIAQNPQEIQSKVDQDIADHNRRSDVEPTKADIAKFYDDAIYEVKNPQVQTFDSNKIPENDNLSVQSSEASQSNTPKTGENTQVQTSGSQGVPESSDNHVLSAESPQLNEQANTAQNEP
ncbi:conjugal transfer protein TraG N-terminal domain-containing protein, partial [Psychromonas aquimarina]|uniref:conjugal transfer protein TraG N-terminal domain-containing protein n=1 Tax=Psychromonas aquimarina TaxID=444919 RepID=UPI00056933DF